MARFALPAFKLILAGALAAGIWVVHDDGSRKPVAQAPAPRAKPVQRSAEKATQPPAPARAKPAARVAALPGKADAPPKRPSRMVTGAIPRTQATERQQVEATAEVRVRARPATDARVVGGLKPGGMAWQLGRSGDWRLVSVGDTAGWVHGDYLTAVRRPAAPVPGKTAKAALKTP